MRKEEKLMSLDFYKGNDPIKLLNEYGSPLYVYSEDILRLRCREIKGLCEYKNFRVNFSPKANSNPAVLQIVRSEGLDSDAMSPGEMAAALLVGFKPEQILFIANNVSEDEMRFAIERGILVSVDSLSQLERYGKINAGGRAALRINPGIGAGHHEKVVTAGKHTKFAINIEDLDEAKNIAARYNLKIAGLNQHIGSLFMDGGVYVQAADVMFGLAKQFDTLEFIDLGGGFGTPYRKAEGEPRLDLAEFKRLFDKRVNDFIASYGKEVKIIAEPGRYISAECGVLLGNVHAVKYNSGVKYIGTDIGFNVLMRPVLYGSHHDIEIYPASGKKAGEETELATVVGNICETGDILAKDAALPKDVRAGDVIAVMDAGAYGFTMSSNYNNRQRPAELLIRRGGAPVLIRRRDTIDDVLKNYILLQ